MRTDKEQLDRITETYEKREAAGKRRRRTVTVAVAMALAVAMIVSSVIFLPGLIRGNSDNGPAANTASETEAADPATGASEDASTPSPSKSGGSEYYIVDDGKVDKLSGDAGPREPGGLSRDERDEYLKDAYVSAPVPSDPFFYSGDSDTIVIPVIRPGIPGGEGDQTVYTAGTLTGAELNDRLRFEEYLKSVKELLEKDPSIQLFDTSAASRVKVTVKDGETPQSFVTVKLFEAGNEEPLWTAVTDNKGEAFLYYNVRAGIVNNPAYLEYASPFGTGSYNLVSQDKVEEDVVLSLAGRKTKKLDLMFMIDTTGSMGDELEYIKTEIRDIIAKVVGDQNYFVRTSVNFYRDKGDAYIVHATPFTTDTEKVYEYIRKEYATGGGDTPEAVHTALDNAIGGHEWDEDAVKLCFFVLDAPPHYESQEYGDSIYDTLRGAVRTAAEQGIRIIPIVSSGSDALTEYLMRAYAVMTGGTYTFLTDHSGIGNPHATPDTGVQYDIEKLNEMIIRIAREYLE